MYAHVHTCMYICMYVCTCAYMCVYMCAWHSCVRACVCMCGGVAVSGFALISDPLRTKVHLMGHSLAVRNEYLPICLRFSSHIVTLFKATQYSVLPVFVALYLHVTFCWKTQAFQKNTLVLSQVWVAGVSFFLQARKMQK